MLVREVVEALGRGERVHDLDFDALMPVAARGVSRQFWSPVAVALQVARWVDALGLGHVVDLGSGAGKLCVVASLASRARFTGIEQRAGLVASARTLATTFGVDDRVSFRVGVLDDVPPADAYYVFNPFEENLHGPADRIDDTVALGPEAYDRGVARVEALLQAAPTGTCVILYNGFGGALPDSFDALFHNGDALRPLGLWRKR